MCTWDIWSLVRALQCFPQPAGSRAGSRAGLGAETAQTGPQRALDAACMSEVRGPIFLGFGFNDPSQSSLLPSLLCGTA